MKRRIIPAVMMVACLLISSMPASLASSGTEASGIVPCDAPAAYLDDNPGGEQEEPSTIELMCGTMTSLAGRALSEMPSMITPMMGKMLSDPIGTVNLIVGLMGETMMPMMMFILSGTVSDPAGSASDWLGFIGPLCNLETMCGMANWLIQPGVLEELIFGFMIPMMMGALM
jgi:hypothetical protein